MKSKTPFILTLIGLIIGFFSILEGFIGFFFFRNSSNIWGVDVASLATLGLINSIVGLVIGIIILFYLPKLRKNPKKKDFITLIVLGAISIFTGLGIGGILILIGAIIGLNKAKK